MDTDRSTAAVAPESLLRSITDRIPARVTYYDRDLVCRFANRAQAERYGRTPQQMVGAHLSELIPPAMCCAPTAPAASCWPGPATMAWPAGTCRCCCGWRAHPESPCCPRIWPW